MELTFTVKVNVVTDNGKLVQEEAARLAEIIRYELQSEGYDNKHLSIIARRDDENSAEGVLRDLVTEIVKWKEHGSLREQYTLLGWIKHELQEALEFLTPDKVT